MKKIFTTVLLTVLTTFVFAQGVANYGVTRNTGVTYNSISGTGTSFTGWRNGTSTDDNLSGATNIGFTFTYLGTPYTQFSLSTNGYITFNTGTAATGAGLGAYGYDNVNFSATAGTVSSLAPFYDDQQTAGNLGTLADLNATYKYLVTGIAGSRVLTVEWINSQDFSTTSTSSFNYQIKLYEADNHIEYNYGTMLLANSGTITTMSYSIGINNATISAVPTVSELLTQQTVNTATFNNTASNALGGNVPANMPTAATQIVFTLLPACTTPANQPTGLNLIPSPGSIAGNFTAAVSAPSNYLVVRTTTPTPPTAPVDGTTYTPGTSALGGVIVSNGTTTNFNATGLTPLTTYYFWVYSFNAVVCSGGPLYLAASPLNGSSATTACSGLSGTYSVGPTGTYPSLTAALAAAQLGLSGNVIFELQSTYVSSVETFPLVISPNVCVNAGQTITIRPELGATALSITSANATGTINFDGGDYVSFDGRPGGVGVVSQLTLSNTVTTGYTVQFINNAVFNNIRYCTVSGVNTSGTSGVIFFSNAVGLTAGNSNNTIDNCDIRDGATTPTNLIYNSGNTTDLASGNNNNTVSNSLLHDWFNATLTTAGAAVNIFNGASAWTITGNSFYQSVTRTFTMTTSTDQGAIFVNSPTFGSNYTISNNFIGGTAPLCGGTAWTYTGGASGTPVPRLIRFNSAVGTTSNITNNTIQNIAITSSSTSTAHSLISQINGNINIANNTIGSQTAVGNITFTLASTSTAPFFLPIGTGTGATLSTINIANNNIGGINVSSSSTGSVSFRVIYAQPVAGSTLTITGNTIGGTIANSIRQQTTGAAAGNGSLFGILILNPTIGDVVTNNIVRNLTIALATPAAGSSLTGINVQAGGGGHTITGNSIFNLTTNSTNVAINNAASVVGLTMTGNVVGGTNVSSNTIYNLTNTNTTVAGWINGMYFGTAPSFPQTIIAKNNVHSINLASAVNNAGMAGIFLPNTGFAQVNNNMVRLGIDANGASITNALQIVGIHKASSATMSIYHNTVYIGGTGVVSAVANTFAFRRSISGATQDTLMNNIFYNARSNASGTGKHYAINTNAATLLYSNYNDLLANGTGGVLGVNVATDYTTLPLWNAATNQDWNSISSDPILVNPTGTSATVDLHVNTGLATPVEQAGYNLPLISDDFDSQVRSGLTPVDIGADAANFIVSDIAPPVIYLTPLINTCGTGDRLVTNITITDATGVPTSGALVPRIYYRKNAGAYFSQPGTLTSGTGTNGTWDFTIVAADMGGLIGGDVVSYYIIAQDIVGTPNIASNFGGAIATDVNTVITQPTTPNTYNISGTSLSGSYNVGAGQTYTTLTAAVAAYNSACLTGPVTFLLTDASYSAGETFPIVINANPYSSVVNTLTIKPTLANTTITGSTTTSILNVNGGDNIIIDGSINNTANTVCPVSVATRDLTISQTNVATTTGVVWLSTTAALDAVTNCTVKNCIVIGQSNANTILGIGAGGTGIASGGTGNNNLSFINNDVRTCRVGIFTKGAGPTSKNQNLTISQNIMISAGTSSIGETGIYASYTNNILVTGNTISNIIRTGSPDCVAINMGFGEVSGFTTTATGLVDGVSNVLISNNTIGAIENSGAFSAAGIALGNTATGTSIVANNMVYGVKANGTLGDFAGGIVLGGGTGQVNVYHNSVSMQGTITGASSASQISTCLAVTSPIASPIDIRNNIFSNTQIGNAGATLRFATIALGYSAPYTGLISNYNDLYSAGAGPGTYTVGVTGGLLGTNRTTLAAWQTETGGDVNSTNVLPVFTSATDLHLTTANCGLDNKGTNLSIPLDFDCQTRDAITPDLGADEFSSTASNTLYNAVGTTITDTRTVTGLEIFRAPNCERFASLLPNGGSPVTGSVTARVYKYATVQTYNAEPYVQRVIDITPATGATTATGRVTLYYTDQEFVDFNTASGPWPDLPTVAGGANADPNISNLRITKYGGTPNTTPSSPNMYSAGTYLYINPADPDIVWNAVDSRWEVTVDVTGFSGFYVHTNSQYALPITFNYLNGVRQGANHFLNWKVTCTGSPTATLILERSGDNRTFTAVNSVTATALRCQDPFNYTDANPLLGLNYYRVKIIDALGRVSYGNTIALLNAVKGFEVLNVAPNPVTSNGAFKLNVSAAKAETIGVVITDMQGRTIERKQVNIIGGYNSIPMDISKLAAGTYNVQVTSSIGDKSKVLRVVKQ